ncbi:transcription factor TFIIIB component B [Biomphalaria pfeifferi]|uniref:Transcription factor TFIIIB component B n=1 Tax=Biomphalaria pfeifferi TaxID=112525 RepID=A0AAD8BUL3_BIOPF|nr:transcription factor TFIIIB component B [Biomphalaria pfeifferi]
MTDFRRMDSFISFKSTTRDTMSTLTEMIPCSFEQGKAEASKGITRRPRFVMKPNIRPGPSKPISTGSKPKLTNSPAAAETPPIVSRSAHPTGDEANHHTENENAKSVSTVDDCSTNQTQAMDKNAEVASVPTALNSQVTTRTEESVSKSVNNLCAEASKKNEILLQAMSSTDSSLACDKLDKTDHHEKQLSVSSKISVCEAMPEQKSVKELTGVDHPDTTSEGDGTSVSECMSLEPDGERRADVEEDLKKKKRRSKKQRTEPLPSREKSPDRQKMKMSDLLSWNPQQNFMPKKVKKKDATSALPEQVGSKADEDRESSNQSASLPAPQVMIGPDGSVVLNTESLLIPSAPAETKLPTAIEEDDDDRYLNTNSYRKYKRTKFWTEDETDRFFLGLQMCGTDFSLMTNLLTNRTRRELKNKFHREEKRNRPLIDKALANRRMYDPAPFAEMIAAEEVKLKKLAEKKVKPKPETKKDKKPAKKKTDSKRKKSVSENEEDDWNATVDDDHDDVVEESPVAKRKKKSEPKVPVSVKPSAADKPGFDSHPTNTSSSPAQTALGNNALQSIPGSSQVQIEMEGVNNPVQGVLIPKSMIPLIAPQLGIPATATDYQVLLVQEQSSSGNLVHVYIIPDSEKKDSTPSSGSTSLPTQSTVHGPTGISSLQLSNISSPGLRKNVSYGAQGQEHCAETHRPAPGSSLDSYVPSSSVLDSAHSSLSYSGQPSSIASHHTAVVSALSGPYHQTPMVQEVVCSPSQTCSVTTSTNYSGNTVLPVNRTNPINELKSMMVEDDHFEEDGYTLTSL